MALVGIAVAVVVAFFVFAPVVYSPTKVYMVNGFVGSGGVVGPGSQLNATYPNWDSLSCWAFGFGVYYGMTVSQHGSSYQLGCHPPPFWSGL